MLYPLIVILQLIHFSPVDYSIFIKWMRLLANQGVFDEAEGANSFSVRVLSQALGANRSQWNEDYFVHSIPSSKLCVSMLF